MQYLDNPMPGRQLAAEIGVIILQANAEDAKAATHTSNR
jgi:hypothetical protein